MNKFLGLVFLNLPFQDDLSVFCTLHFAFLTVQAVFVNLQFVSLNQIIDDISLEYPAKE